ncbi:MAG: UbiH/UbiF/VisC/COQ6 family ubiquinone biosynthesis hydroxylase [Alphaproteobacteria bacterium]
MPKTQNRATAKTAKAKSTAASSQNYDVIINGGGLAGLTLACLLGQGGVRTAVIEKADIKSGAMSGDERTTAISYGSAQILAKAGLWVSLEKHGCPIRDIHILDGESPVLLRFMSGEVEDKAFGTIILNRTIRQIMLQRLAALTAYVDILPPASIRDFNLSSDQSAMDVHLQNGDTIHAKLLVGADGRNSFLREKLDIPVRRKTYKQQAVICIIGHEHPHNNAAIEHFWPEGPFAILPMRDQAQDGARDEAQDGSGNKASNKSDNEKNSPLYRSSIVFTEHQKRGKPSLTELDRAAFEAVLQERVPAQYGTIRMIGERTAYPLSLVHAAHYIENRAVLVADAAHGIHPIAGQGLNLGFRDVDELAALVIKAQQEGGDIGSFALLETYQRRRRPDNTAMVAFTDIMVKLFSNNMRTAGFVRKIGLRAVAALPPAKRFFMRQAMADRGGKP